MSDKSEVGTEESQLYQETWDEFLRVGSKAPVALLPLEIGINKKGEIFRHRMKGGEIKTIWGNIKNDFPHYMAKRPDLFDEAFQIFDDYITYFEKKDGEELSPPRTPLDIIITKPTWLLYSLGNPNWKFCKTGPQYSTENDLDDQTRNFVKIATFNDDRQSTSTAEYGQPMNERKLLLLANRNRSAPKNLKFNFHVDVLQILFGKENSTTIIIDPGGTNFPDYPFP